MRLKLRILQFGVVSYAEPACCKSRKACELLNQKYLTPEQIKSLELMGCNIKVVNEKRIDTIGVL